MEKIFRNMMIIIAFLGMVFGFQFCLYAQDEFMLEEITVTAEKREENVQNSPIAITAITGQVLSNKQKNTLDEALKDVPGLQMAGLTFGGSFFVRGIGTNTSKASVPMSVNMNIDGVYQANSRLVYQSIYDVSRIEVLRGPHGTLYGRNATAGSVNIVTSEVVDKFEASGSIQVGNYNEMRTEGMVNVPVNDKLGFRAAFQTERHDGYLSNGNMNSDTFGARFKARYQPNEDLEFVATYEYKVDESVKGTVPTLASHESDPWYSDHIEGLAKQQNNTFSLSMDLNLDWGVLTFLPSYSESEQFENVQMIFPITAQGGTEDQIMGELRLASPAESSIEWVGGIYYMKADNEDLEDVENRLDPDATISTVDPNDEQVFELQHPYSNWAVFGQLTYPLTDRLRLTGGTRYTKDIRDLDYKITVEATGYDSGVITLEGDYSKFTYKAGVEYDISDKSMMYGSISTGYNTGGWMLDDPPVEYEPEELVAYAIGSKNRFFNDRLQVNSEAFYYDYDNYQVSYMGIHPTTGAVMSLRANASSMTSYGLEIESNYILTNNDRIDVTLAYLDAKFNEFIYEESASGGMILRDYSNTVPPNSPKWSGTIGYEHTWDLMNAGQLSFEGNIHYSTEYYTTFEKYLDETLQESYHRSDAYIAYYPSENKWSIRLYCKNIEDDAQRVYALPASRISITAPRTYGVKFTARF